MFNYSMFDFGRLIIYIFLSGYFITKFFRKKTALNFSLGLIGILGLISLDFIIEPYRTKFAPENIVYSSLKSCILWIIVITIIIHLYQLIKCKLNR